MNFAYPHGSEHAKHARGKDSVRLTYISPRYRCYSDEVRRRRHAQWSEVVFVVGKLRFQRQTGPRRVRQASTHADNHIRPHAERFAGDRPVQRAAKLAGQECFDQLSGATENKSGPVPAHSTAAKRELKGIDKLTGSARISPVCARTLHIAPQHTKSLIAIKNRPWYVSVGEGTGNDQVSDRNTQQPTNGRSKNGVGARGRFPKLPPLGLTAQS